MAEIVSTLRHRNKKLHNQILASRKPVCLSNLDLPRLINFNGML